MSNNKIMENFEPKIEQKITKASELRVGNVFKLPGSKKWANKNFLAFDIVLPTVKEGNVVHELQEKTGVKAVEAELTNEGWKPTQKINNISIDIDEEIEIIEK